MVTFILDKIRTLMNETKNIRNVCVMGQMNCGKTTLIDSLVSKAGIIIQQDEDIDFKETQIDEQKRCMTTTPTANLLYYELPVKDFDVLQQEDRSGIGDILINMIDTPGHVDFSSDVTTALRITDGTLIIIDCISGIGIQNELVIRQSIVESVKPILLLNKIDRILFEYQLEQEDIFQEFQRIINNINTIITTYNVDNRLTDEFYIDPRKGTVAFGCTLDNWAFTLKEFSEMYSTKFQIKSDKLLKYFWGDYFYSSSKNQWSKTVDDTEDYARGFCQFILEPILKIYRSIENDEYKKLVEKLNIKFQENDYNTLQAGEKTTLLKLVMKRWLPIDDILLRMITIHLPSPLVTQKYRMEYLYEGRKDDEIFSSIQSCDPNGPLMMYISKMIPTSDKTRFYAFGRVFSGNVQTDQKVCIMGRNYVHGKKEDLYIKTIQKPVLLIGRSVVSIENVPCGNICALVGIDQYLVKNGTITTFENAYNLRKMKLNSSPIVRVTVEARNPNDLPKLIEGLKFLSKSDPAIECIIEDSGEHIIACASDFHLKICLKNLGDYLDCIPIKVSDPFISYRETVSDESEIMCLSKSPNKHTRMWMKAQPMPQGLSEDIEQGRITTDQDVKARARYLNEKYDYDMEKARRIWCFGPEQTGANFLVDCTKGVQYLNELKDYCIMGFQWATKEGILADENVRGVCFNIHDVTHTPDAIHRGGGQIIPTIRRLVYASMLTAKPRLFQPIYLYQIQCPKVIRDDIYAISNRHHVQIIEEYDMVETSMLRIKGYVPVNTSLGFNDDLHSNTNNRVFSQSIFDHWQIIDEDPFDETSNIRQIINNIRERKGLKEGIPPLDHYCDRL